MADIFLPGFASRQSGFCLLLPIIPRVVSCRWFGLHFLLLTNHITVLSVEDWEIVSHRGAVFLFYLGLSIFLT